MLTLFLMYYLHNHYNYFQLVFFYKVLNAVITFFLCIIIGVESNSVTDVELQQLALIFVQSVNVSG